MYMYMYIYVHIYIYVYIPQPKTEHRCYHSWSKRSLPAPRRLSQVLETTDQGYRGTSLVGKRPSP